MLQSLEDSVEAAFDLFGLGEGGVFDALVDLEDVDHELAVGGVDFLGHPHALQLHEVDRALQVVEQRRLGLVDVGRVFSHFGGQCLRVELADLIGVKLPLEVLGHVADGFGVDGVVLWAG